MAEPSISRSPPLNHRLYANPRPPKLPCFSFAAYAKSLVARLASLDIPVLPGLSDSEFCSVESAFGFCFPPDLRSILQEGLPVAHGFPNWRSSSFQQLHILIKLPKLFLLKEISRQCFWCDAWGCRPDDRNQALAVAERLFEEAPLLVPVYRNCYVPSSPNMAGNPVFYVNGGDVRVLSHDLAGFFQRAEFLHLGECGLSECFARFSAINAPAWTATESRRIWFWTELSESAGKVTARENTSGWWTGGESGVDGCMEEAFWRLRNGGWREEEVREMMMMNDEDENSSGWPTSMNGPDVFEAASTALLRGGWAMEDVVYSLDLQAIPPMPLQKISQRLTLIQLLRRGQAGRPSGPAENINI